MITRSAYQSSSSRRRPSGDVQLNEHRECVIATFLFFIKNLKNKNGILHRDERGRRVTRSCSPGAPSRMAQTPLHEQRDDQRRERERGG